MKISEDKNSADSDWRDKFKQIYIRESIQLVSISLGTLLLLLVGFHYTEPNSSLVITEVLKPAYVLIAIVILFLLPTIPACRAYIHREKE